MNDAAPTVINAVPTTDFDGRFACARLTDAKVQLFTDCLGAGSLYYAQRDGSFFFGTHLGPLVQLLPDDPKANDLGLVAQLLGRSQIFDETHFAGIFRLNAGAQATVEPAAGKEGVNVKFKNGNGVVDLITVKAPRYCPESLRDLIDLGVKREGFNDNSLLMLSGGRDSLAIALARVEAAGRLRSATYGERYSSDFIRGRRRAKALGREHLSVPYTDWSLNSYGEQIIGFHAGCSGLQTAHNIVAFHWARNVADLTAVGFLGDVLTGAHLGPSGEPNEAQALDILLPNHTNPIFNNVFSREKASVIEYTIDTFNALSKVVGGRRALMVLDLQWRQARWISMMFDLCDWFIPVACPFMQRTLIASCLQGDGSALKNQRTYDAALAQGFAASGASGRYPDPVTTRLSDAVKVRITAFRAARKPVCRCDWNAVIARTRLDLSKYLCGHERLDFVTQESWKKAVDEKVQTVPLTCESAVIGAALAASKVVETSGLPPHGAA